MKSKSYTVEELKMKREYDKTKDMVETDFYPSMKNMNYENYSRFKTITEAHRIRKDDISEVVQFIIQGSLGIIIATTLALTTSLWGLLVLIFTAIPFGIALFQFRGDEKSRLYNTLYKKIKKRGDLEDLKAYMKVYEQSAEFHEDKKRYEYNKSKRELDKAIDDASRDIEEKEREKAHLSKVAEVEENEERLIVVADELGTVRNCDKLGTALPLIAKMLERYKKIEVVPVENVKTPVENTETEQDLDEEHKSIFSGINFGDLDD